MITLNNIKNINRYIMIFILYLLMFYFSVCSSFASDNILDLSLQSSLIYKDLEEKPDDIDTVCQFPSSAQKIQIMQNLCNFDDELKNSTKILDNFCTFKDAQHRKNSITTYCSVRTPRSQTKIIGNFCNIENERKKLHYIEYLNDIAAVGDRFVRIVNFNVEEERFLKHKDSLDPAIYHVALEPHTEAAYELGVIHGFSTCGMRDPQKAITFFQRAHNKPETFFMTAELYRGFHNKKLQKRIYTLYNNAIKVGINEARYNLALYIYETLQKKTANDSLPQGFTYRNVITYLKQAVKHNDAIAQNDLAVLISRLYVTQSNQKAWGRIIDAYITKSAAQGFMPALYNQTVLILQKQCSKTTQPLFNKNMGYLLQKKYQPAVNLLSTLNNSPDACHKNMIQQVKNTWHQEQNPVAITAMMEKSAFIEIYDKMGLEYIIRSGY